MKRIAYTLPPLFALAALVLHGAGEGFAVLNLLFHPLVLAALVAITAVVLARRYDSKSLLNLSVPFLLWIAFGVLAGFFWLGLRSGRFIESEWMIPTFLGLGNIFSASWMKFLIASACSILLAFVFTRHDRQLLFWGGLSVAVGLLLLTIESIFGMRIPINVVPGRTISHVFSQTSGEIIQMPFSFKVERFTVAPPITPELLKISTRSGRTIKNIAITGPTSFKIPGTGTIATIDPHRFSSRTVRGIRQKSADYLNPAVLVREFKDGTELTDNTHIIFGLLLGNNVVYLPASNVSLFYRHYIEKGDFEALQKTNLPYLPFVEVRMQSSLNMYILQSVIGGKLDIPTSHYKLEVMEAQQGDFVTGEIGETKIKVRGPRGEEVFHLSENNPSLAGNLYPNFRLNYLHPRSEGESTSFVRVSSCNDLPTSRVLFLNGVHQIELSAKGEVFQADRVHLRISEPVPEAIITESLRATETGVSGMKLKLLRENGDTLEVNLSPEMILPLELPREEVLLSLQPAAQQLIESAQIVLSRQNGPVKTVKLTPDKPLRFSGMSLALLDYDHTLGSYVTIVVAKNIFGIWPLVLMALGILLAATESGMGLFSELKKEMDKRGEVKQ